MGEVRYSLNGKYFKDYGVYVSESDGLFDALKRKKANSYDWAEYNGNSVDLSAPKFEAREITLYGFVIGKNWEAMKSNFDNILCEFVKPGTQRLLIEPLGLKPLPFEVYLEDSVKLEKKFKKSQMVGTFSIKLIEPNPLKIVLLFTGRALDLSYNCSSETEIFYGNGLKETAEGNVTIVQKTISNRETSGYAFGGRNTYRRTNGFTLLGAENIQVQQVDYGFSILGAPSENSGIRINNVVNSNGVWTVSFLARGRQNAPVRFKVDICDIESEEFYTSGNNDWVNVVKTVDVTNYDLSPADLHFVDIDQIQYAYLDILNIKVEKGEYTGFSLNPNDEKYIVIAGNIDQISDLNTNAEVLWEKL